MKLLLRLFVVAACLTPVLSVNAQTLLSDFSGSANLGSSTALVGTGGAYSVSGGVANFTATSPGDTEFVLVRYTGAVGSFDNNWSVRIDVNYANPSSIFTSGVEQFMNLGLLVTRSDTTPGVSSNQPNFHAFLVESNVYQMTSDAYSRDIRTAIFAPGSNTDGTRYAETNPIGSPSAFATAVQISYNATTNVLSAGYDADGASGGYSFTNMTDQTVNVATTWSMTSGNTFSIYLMGASGYDGSTSGVGPTVTAGEATLDNLYGTNLTAVPEPSTYAAIAGALALGAAVWRRRQRNEGN